MGEEKGLMEGFFLKKLVIHTKEEEYVRDHAMIGITREKISSNQDYEIIIHPDMMEKVEHNLLIMSCFIYDMVHPI